MPAGCPINHSVAGSGSKKWPDRHKPAYTWLALPISCPLPLAGGYWLSVSRNHFPSNGIGVRYSLFGIGCGGSLLFRADADFKAFPSCFTFVIRADADFKAFPSCFTFVIHPADRKRFSAVDSWSRPRCPVLPMWMLQYKVRSEKAEAARIKSKTEDRLGTKPRYRPFRLSAFLSGVVLISLYSYSPILVPSTKLCRCLLRHCARCEDWRVAGEKLKVDDGIVDAAWPKLNDRCNRNRRQNREK
jgi:hypothetical protein